MEHYSGETLFDFLQGMTPIEAGVAKHVADCAQCTGEVEELRRLIRALQDPQFWEVIFGGGVPGAERSELIALAERVFREDERARSLCEEVLTGPAAWWPQRLRTAGGTRTAGMVRQLLLRRRASLGRAPKEALIVTGMAVSVAEELDTAAYPRELVDDLRAQALRDHAYVLTVLARYAEAAEYAERSAALFAGVPASQFERARLYLVEATILRYTGQEMEAARLCGKAAEVFLEYGDRARYVSARVTEGTALHLAGAVERALEIWTSVEGDPALDAAIAVQLRHNIALCHVVLGQPLRAIEPLCRCVADFAMLGLETERTRSRSVLGQALLVMGRPRAAAAILRRTAEELAELGMIFEYGRTALEAAEALIAAGRRHEVPPLCREIISRVTAAGLASQAMAALAYLREVEGSEAPVDVVRAARAAMPRTAGEAPRAFASPPPPPKPPAR